MKALALVDAPDHVCCRYRILAFEPAIRRIGGSIQAVSLARGPLGRINQFRGLKSSDVVILQRKLLPGWQLALLRRAAGHLVFDFDDAILFRDSFDPRGPHSPRRAKRFAATVRAADTVIAGNDFLADCALRAGARADQVRVIPTCIPIERYPAVPDRTSRSAIELVWIGSSSTLQGLEQNRPLWDRLARQVNALRMRVICDRFPDLGPMPVEKVPWNEATEAEDLAAGDIGVTWLPDDLWSRGKCGLKLLQYQAASLPVVANPVGVHTEMVEPGMTGFLPSDIDEWVDVVSTLATDDRLRIDMGRAARESVERRYAVSAWEATFTATLSGASAATSGTGLPIAPPRLPGHHSLVGRGTIEATG